MKKENQPDQRKPSGKSFLLSSTEKGRLLPGFYQRLSLSLSAASQTNLQIHLLHHLHPAETLQSHSHQTESFTESVEMNPQVDKLVRRTTMVATVTASYFLLTADYGPEPNVLDPVKNAILSAQRSVKEIFIGPEKGNPKAEKRGKPEESNSSSSKGNP